MAEEKKRYGLILKRSVQKAPAVVKPSIFNDSSDEESLASVSRPGKAKTEGRLRTEHAAQIAKALEEDPTAFAYDEVYEEIAEKRNAKKEREKQNRDYTPKYVGALLTAAKKRQLEHEAREERKQQREREKEGEEFAEKEVFVTGAYRKKLEELEEHNKEMERMDRINSMMDVSKQNDLSGFYRNFLNDLTKSRDVTNKYVWTVRGAVFQNNYDTKNRSEKESAKADVKPIAQPKKTEKKYRRPRHSSTSSSGSESERRRRSISDKSTDSDSDEDRLRELVDESKRQRSVHRADRHKRFYTPSPSRGSDSGDGDHRRNRNSLEDRIALKRTDGRKRSTERRSERKSYDDSKKRMKSSIGESVSEPPKDDILGVVPPKIALEHRLEQLKAAFAHRNSEEAIEAYRARYLMRKAAQSQEVSA